MHIAAKIPAKRLPQETIKSVIENGRVIKDYPDDTPYPSRLILGFDGERPVHVVSAYNAENDTEYVITVYEPDVQKWSNNFTERR